MNWDAPSIKYQQDALDLRLFLYATLAGENMDHEAQRFIDLGWIVQNRRSQSGYSLTLEGMRARDH